MRKILLLLALVCALTARAQVDNYCLRFTADDGVVNLGRIAEAPLGRRYTLQLWICPDSWTPGGAIVRCGTFSIKMGREHTLVVGDGHENIIVGSDALKVGAWAHITLRTDDTETRIDVNNQLAIAYPATLNFPAADYSTWLGGRYHGRIDEVRVWDHVLSKDYDSFWRTTLNDLNPAWDHLVGYWKMDQEQCANLVDYRDRHHGTLSTSGVEKSKVTDNAQFKYLYSLAYGNIERYCDRTIDRDHYRLSNRICIIAAHLNSNDGHIYPDVSNEEATYNAKQGDEYLAEFQGRQGVLSLSRDGFFTAPWGILDGCSAYTIETWLCLDQWTEGGYVFRKETADCTQGISLRLGSEDDHTLIVRCNGTDFVYPNAGELGQWHHVSVCLGDKSSAADIVRFCLDGQQLRPANADEITPSNVATTLTYQGTPIHFGLDLAMKLDDTMVFKSNRNAAADMKEVPLPGPERLMWYNEIANHLACYSYDLPKRLTLDAFSVPGLFYRMRTYTEGMRGVKYILGVAGNNFTNWFSKDAERKRIADEITAIAKDEVFDGVDLDFEWPSQILAWEWENYAHVCEALHWRLLDYGKTKSISPHYVSCNFPVAGYQQYVDYFNFQVYDRKDLFTTDGFDAARQLFEAYKFPKNKTVLSYATTTTEGYNGNSVDKNCPPQAYRYLYPGENSYDPTRNYMSKGGRDYYLNSYNQVIWRAKYIVDHDLGGIMYWDMGGDLPSSHRHSFARAASLHINANVERLVTSVDNAAPAPADDELRPIDTPDPTIEESRIISSLSELQNDMVYNIVNANGLGTLCYNGNTTNVWLGASSNSNFNGWVDLFNDGAQWMIIRTDGQYYLYCLQPAKFVDVPNFNVTSQPTYYTATATPIEVTCDTNGTFAFRTVTSAERGYLCASPHLKNSPVCQWTATDNGSRWLLHTRPEVFAAPHLKRALLLINPLDFNTDGRISIGDIPHGVLRGATLKEIEEIKDIILTH